MAKKVVATLKTNTGKSYAKVIRMVRSPKTNAYTLNGIFFQFMQEGQKIIGQRFIALFELFKRFAKFI